MLTRDLAIRWSVLVIVLGACGIVAALGPLDPPAGPVAPTYKTLVEVEPRTTINGANTPGDADSVFKITQPGSYYLSSNVPGQAGKVCIEIAASNVVIDMMGFNLQGAADSISGIRSDAARNVIVRNGSVTGFPQAGIDLASNFAGPGSVVESVLVSNNAGSGIVTFGGTIVRNCVAIGNGTGISMGGQGIVTDCIARQNGIGITGANGSVVARCTASDGGTGINVGTGCTVSECVASSNSAEGIRANIQSTVAHCTLFANSGRGILVGIGTSVIDCTVFQNTAEGIYAFGGCTITNCTVSLGLSDGIVADSANGHTISGCTLFQNRGNGIVVSGSTAVRENTCERNGTLEEGAGIRSTGSYNRIEANACTGSDRGIEVAGSQNIIVKNTCGNNTVNYELAADNRYGPIVILFGAAAPVSGSSAPSTLSSNDPWANFAN